MEITLYLTINFSILQNNKFLKILAQLIIVLIQDYNAINYHFNLTSKSN